jgi:hypothetical protein
VRYQLYDSLRGPLSGVHVWHYGSARRAHGVVQRCKPCDLDAVRGGGAAVAYQQACTLGGHVGTESAHVWVINMGVNVML